MLAVSSLSLTDKNKVQLFKGISLTVSPSECVGFIGASGSGKSLIAHALVNAVPEDTHLTGQISVEGSIALVPQSATFLNPTNKVYKQISRRQSHGYDFDKLQALNLTEDILNKYPGHLSGGMTKLVLTAIALVQDTRFVVADEPTTGLDSNQAKLVLSTLSSLKQENKGIIIISHDIVELVEYVDRLIVFYDGEIVEETNKQKLINGECKPYTKALWLASPKNWKVEPYDKTA